MYWPPSGELMKQQQHGSSFSPALAGLTFTSRTIVGWQQEKLLECLAEQALR